MANERMVQNEVLLDKLYNAVQDGLFEQQKKDEPTNDMATNGKEVSMNYRCNITLQPLPNLNLWKTASVVMNKGSGENSNNNDADVIAFGGQDIGPDMIDEPLPYSRVTVLPLPYSRYRIAVTV